jgi:molecular chaperone GrpE (heat shock protein)
VKNLEAIAKQISFATGQWQSVNDHSSKAVASATEIGEKMAAEARAFGEFMQKANDTEKANLRLEVDKWRRSENDWLQVVIRMLDHAFALHSAAVRSGKTGLIQQITQFQDALRDSARRVGLAPFAAEPGETFDPDKHQASETEKPGAGATVEATLATGFTFRGKLIRPALVKLASEPADAGAATVTPDSPSTTEEPTPQEQTLL